MNRWLVWLGLVVLTPCLAGGCGTQNNPVKEKVKVLEEAADVLENVYTEGAAPAAKPDLKRLGDRLKALDQEIAALPADQRSKLERQHQAAIDAALMRIKNREMRMRAIRGGGDAYDQLGIK